eukprot:COSAG01_NODE_2652_length_7308_cov_3.492995_8_plen_189_part_01
MWPQSACDTNDQCRSWTVNSNQCCLYEAVACPTQKPTYASGAKVPANITCGCSSFCSADGLHCLGGSVLAAPTIPLACSLSTNIDGMWRTQMTPQTSFQKPITSCSASSEYDSHYLCKNVFALANDWSIAGVNNGATPVGSWIQLNFIAPQLVNTLKFAQRPESTGSQRSRDRVICQAVQSDRLMLVCR